MKHHFHKMAEFTALILDEVLNTPVVGTAIILKTAVSPRKTQKKTEAISPDAPNLIAFVIAKIYEKDFFKINSIRAVVKFSCGI